MFAQNIDYDQIVQKELEILSARRHDKWTGSKFEATKIADRTSLGDFGEGILCSFFNNHGLKSKIINKGKGDYDILVEDRIRVEVKTATEDTSNSFQFNGIKKSGVEYDYVLCLGIAPNDLYINMWTMEECVRGLTTPMTRDGSDSYKLTAGPRRARPRTWEVLPLTEENFKKVVLRKFV